MDIIKALCITFIFVLLSITGRNRTAGQEVGPQPERTRVRKSAKELTDNEWQDLKRGIRHMKQRHIIDPQGFAFQANVHGWSKYYGSGAAKQVANHFHWHKCTHRQHLFLVWHRMYLYFFERILRKASGNPDLTVPYWDYTDPSQRQIPTPFRLPADETANSLFTGHRCRHINEGQPLPAEITDPLPALSSANKSSNELNVCHSMGGGRAQSLAFSSERAGLLERLPHDRIHMYIGGYMADLCNAARDPVFWVHHSMIDRIWESWLQIGGQHLTETQYLNTSFKFYNETGVLGTYYVRDFLDSRRLHYRYDKLLKLEHRIESTDNESSELHFSVDESKELYITNKKRSIMLKIKPRYQRLYDDIARGRVNNSHIRFTLQAVLAGQESGLMFQLYLNLAPNTQPSEDRANFIGTVCYLEANCGPRRALAMTKCFEITDNLFAILQSEFKHTGAVQHSLNLTVVPKSCDETVYPETDNYIIKFDRTLVIHYN